VLPSTQKYSFCSSVKTAQQRTSQPRWFRY
jgi:hypothetical protein